MKIDVEKVRKFLNDKEISAYSIWKGSGVTTSALSRYRSGQRPLENMTLSSIMKIQEYMDEIDYQG